MLKPWQKIDPENEMRAAYLDYSRGYMSFQDFQEEWIECQKMQGQRERFERKQKVRSIRNWRRIIVRALRGRIKI